MLLSPSKTRCICRDRTCFEGKRLKTIGQGVIVPTAVYKAVYMPKTGAIGAYYAPNNNLQQVKVVSVCYIEEKLGINLFPQLTEQQNAMFIAYH